MYERARTYFTDATGLTNGVRWALYIFVACAVVSLICGAMEVGFISAVKAGSFPSEAALTEAEDANDIRQGLVAIAYALVYLVTGILVLKWIYRANKNARALGADDLEFSPGWSVGWYFVPFLNIVRPYQAMMEIWQASANPLRWRAEVGTPLLGWWWALWLIFNVTSNVSLRLSMQAKTPDDMIFAGVVNMISDVTAIPLTFCLLLLVNRIYEMQTIHASRVGPQEANTRYNM